MPVRNKNCNCRNSRCLKLYVVFLHFSAFVDLSFTPHRLPFTDTNFQNVYFFFLFLVRYCECFASGLFCDRCNCVNCCNNLENAAVRQEAVEATLERNPNAFRPKIAPSPGGTVEEAEGAGRHNKVLFERIYRSSSRLSLVVSFPSRVIV